MMSSAGAESVDPAKSPRDLRRKSETGGSDGGISGTRLKRLRSSRSGLNFGWDSDFPGVDEEGRI